MGVIVKNTALNKKEKTDRYSKNFRQKKAASPRAAIIFHEKSSFHSKPSLERPDNFQLVALCCLTVKGHVAECLPTLESLKNQFINNNLRG
ncbi:hypothetical protein A3762_03215 [Oleiphilus sp. HI0125]|nr:hypothetical protein A3762_03215 [Oleiphilus sp. HI0125]